MVFCEDIKSNYSSFIFNESRGVVYVREKLEFHFKHCIGSRYRVMEMIFHLRDLQPHEVFYVCIFRRRTERYCDLVLGYIQLDGKIRIRTSITFIIHYSMHCTMSNRQSAASVQHYPFILLQLGSLHSLRSSGA